MRRIAAVALAAGTLMAGMTAVSAPASATPAQAPVQAAAVKWAPYNSYNNISAWGTYTRGSKVYVTGYLRDGAPNGWTACVRFLFKEGSKGYWSRHKIIAVKNGVQYNFDGVAKVKITASSSYNDHLYVQECGRNKKTGKYYYGKGKTLF